MSDYIKREDAEQLLRYYFLSALTEDERVDELNKIPSADVVEVRHGRWVDRTQEPGWPVSECSVCGSHAGMFWMNYCPNCGARMDGDNDE